MALQSQAAWSLLSSFANQLLLGNHRLMDRLTCISGYAALAVSTDQGTYTREVETGLGEDREANMIAFSFEAFKLLKDVIKGDANL